MTELTQRDILEQQLIVGASHALANSPDRAEAIAKGIKTLLDALHPTKEHDAATGLAMRGVGVIAPTGKNHASSVLYPAIEQAMNELLTLQPKFNGAVNRAFNHLHDAFWSECPAPASAAPKRPEQPSADL